MPAPSAPCGWVGAYPWALPWSPLPAFAGSAAGATVYRRES